MSTCAESDSCSQPTAQNLELKKAMATMRQIGTRLIDERKLAAVYVLLDH
jgi:hypothetical protein